MKPVGKAALVQLKRFGLTRSVGVSQGQSLIAVPESFKRVASRLRAIILNAHHAGANGTLAAMTLLCDRVE